MKLERVRLVGILLMCFGGFGLVGALLVLHLTSAQFEVVAALWTVAGALAWWKWR